jgi:predicted glycosyltransferase involved in capsule biosynthesis
MKTDIRDMTFIIPVRFDSVARLENLILSVQSLLKNFHTHIMVLEAASYPNGIIQKMLGNKMEYLFLEDRDSVFYKTKYLNIMTRRTCTPFIGIWDADVIIPKEQIMDSIEKLRQGFDVAYPYDGHFYDTSFVIRELYTQNKSIQFLVKNKDKMSLIYGNQMPGGAVFANREAYIKAGMVSEKFYGWGPEDFELYERLKILGLKIHRSEGPLFHLTHSRGSNSAFRSMEQVKSTNKERITTILSSRTELLSDIDKEYFKLYR